MQLILVLHREALILGTGCVQRLVRRPGVGA